MTVELVLVESPLSAQVDEATDLMKQAQNYILHAKASNTTRAYRSDWKQFNLWCAARGDLSLPTSPEVLSLYLTNLASEGVKASTLQRRISSISQANKAAGHPGISLRVEPLASIWKGIRRVHGTAQTGKAPALTADIRAMVDTLPDNLLGVRDRALLLVGFAGAFRRSELVSLDVSDVTPINEGTVVTLRHSKTDQEGQGRKVGIPYGSNPSTCPVRALRAWLESSDITVGPVFRPMNRHGSILPARLSGKSVALVVKRYAEAAGLDPAQYAGHSLRSGLATSAAAAGASERAIMKQTGHKSLKMVRRYIREGSLFRENAAAIVGL